MSLKVKVDTVFKDFNQYNLRILSAALQTSNLMQVELVVTSANDRTHGANSLHYKDKAIDFRTKHLNKDQKDIFIRTMRCLLSDNYDIVFEGANTDNEHLHVEFDLKWKKVPTMY